MEMPAPHPSAAYDSAVVQLYRGELGRSDRWRTRLDTTTNWALTTSAAAVSLSLGNFNVSHLVLVAGLALVVTFLLLEARRYRYYDLWIRRVRLLEDGYFVPMLRQEPPDPDCLRELAQVIDRPQIHLSLFAAVATRVNRAYGPLLFILLASWFVKIYTHPSPPRNFEDYAVRAHIGPVPGTPVMVFMAAFSIALVLFIIAAMLTKAPVGELLVRPRGRRVALWERFSRPYAVRNPRRHAPAPSSAGGQGPGSKSLVPRA